MLTYSYTAFSDEEIHQNAIPSEEEVYAMDNVDLRHMRGSKKDRLNFEDQYVNLAYKYLEDEGEPYPILFKDMAIITKESTKNRDFDMYWTYHVYDREDTDREDCRVLECSMFDKFLRWDKDSNQYKEYLIRQISFKIKVQHIMLFVKDSENWLNTYRKTKVINKFVVPVYLYGFTINTAVKFIRFSDFYNRADHTLIYPSLAYMHDAIRHYVFMNSFVWNHLNNKEVYRTEIFSNNNELLGIRVYDIHQLAARARSNKKLVVSLDFDKKIDLTLHTKVKNMYIGTSRTPSRFCDYKFQVIGHYQHYWVGHGKNKTRINKYIDPYYKNKDKEFKIVKEYQSEENAPRD